MPINSIAFVLIEARPGACGLTDYSARMASGLQQNGVKTALLDANPKESNEIQRTTQGVSILKLTPELASDYDCLVIQIVARYNRRGLDFISKIYECRHRKCALMIHEFWEIDILDYKLSLKARLRSILQQRQLRFLIRKLKPYLITTSNPFYANYLNSKGIPAIISPMPGTIPISRTAVDPNELIEPDWFQNPEGAFIWVVFGSLYAGFWDCNSYFEEVAALTKKYRFKEPKWIICGAQSQDSKRRFLDAAKANGYGSSVVFTGKESPENIDSLMQNADASISGTSPYFWEKSTGVLVAIERNVPVYFPRDQDIEIPTTHELIIRNLQDIISREGLIKSEQSYTGMHSLQNSVARLRNLIESV